MAGLGGRGAWWLVTALGLGLLVLHAGLARDQSLAEMGSTWRYWDDMALAATGYLELRESPAARAERAPVSAAVPAFQQIVDRQMERWRIEPWQFWRTIPDRALQAWQPRASPAPLEDVGRSWLLSAGYSIVGGVAPYLLLWLGVLLALPLFAWVALELRAAGWPAAGPAVILLSALSPFVVEGLTLPHSAFGFYLLAIVALVGLVAWATAEGKGQWRGLMARLALVSLVFAIATIARAGTLLLMPGFVLALHWAGRRAGAEAASRRRAWLRTAVLAAAFLAPYAVLRPPHYHNVWLSLWEGLGDFGTDRGYSWYDTDANRALAKAGLEPFADPKAVTVEHERHFRDAILRDLAAHPVWYAGILARRAAATLGLTHLLPWQPRDGQALRTPRFHYKYTTPADWVGLGSRRVELPVELMWLAPLGVAASWGARRGTGGPESLRSARALKMAGAVLVACLSLPVLVSTASGLETQATVLGYFLSVGLLLDELRLKASRLTASTAARPPNNQVPGSPREA